MVQGALLGHKPYAFEKKIYGSLFTTKTRVIVTMTLRFTDVDDRDGAPSTWHA